MSDITTTAQTIEMFILREFLPGEDSNELTESTELVTGGVIDSLATLKLINFLEGEFSITIHPDEANVDHLNTVASITSLVESKRPL